MKLQRTMFCGEARASHAGQEITVNGWVDNVREIGGLVFVTLRDRTGIIQAMFDRETSRFHEQAKRLAREYVIALKGRVALRDKAQVNAKMPTGEIELQVTDFELLNESKTPPFEVKDALDVDPELRMKYRYVDLRRSKMQHMLEARHRMLKAIRDHFSDSGFLEIETPIMTKATPEGARDFVVPARLHPGMFYALPQSPQIFKQILMVAGCDKYFQVARCFRDEDKRADRQPEFTQIDVEMSFVRESDVHKVIEGCIRRVMKEVLGVEVKLPLPHLGHEEVMQRYGNDKPDTRFGMELVDLSKALKGCAFNAFASVIDAGGAVGALRIPGGHALVSKGQFKNLEQDAKGRGAKALGFIRYVEQGIDSPIAKFLSPQNLGDIFKLTGAETGDLVLLVADKPSVVSAILGEFRNQFGEKLGLRKFGSFNYMWVDSFPLFEHDPVENVLQPAHHPFVQPNDEEALIALAEEMKRSNRVATPAVLEIASKLRATHYDLVVNGVELGSGSLRITKPHVQRAMFDVLGIAPEEAESRFGFLLEALSFGAPPMGGIALGIDRWIMLLLGLDTIQDVIAFPKSSGGKGLMDGSPSTIDPKLMKELQIVSTAGTEPARA